MLRLYTTQVSSIAMTSTLSYLAIGLVSGQVLLYRHVSQSLSTSPLALSTFPKARVVWEGTAAEPITGLGFRDPTLSTSGSNRQDSGLIEGDSDLITDKVAATSSTGLFIVTTNKTIVIPVVTGKGSEPRVLEDVGAGLGCSTMDREGRELIVGRDDGIYIYASEGRGACYAYEGKYHTILPSSWPADTLTLMTRSEAINTPLPTIHRATLPTIRPHISLPFSYRSPGCGDYPFRRLIAVC